MAPDVDQKPRNRNNPGHFGPAVIGEEAYEREKEMVEEGSHIFGPKVVDSHPVSDEDGEPKEKDRSEDPTVRVTDEAFSVAQFDAYSKQGGWFDVVHAPTGQFLNKDGTLTADEEDHDSFGQGEEQAREQIREAIETVQEEEGRPREKFLENEAGDQATEPTPYETEEAEEIVREKMDEEGYLSLEDMDELLEDAYDRLRDRIIDSEFGRADGPRQEGLRKLIAAEQGREDGPRAQVLNRLERALAQLTADPDS